MMYDVIKCDRPIEQFIGCHMDKLHCVIVLDRGGVIANSCIARTRCAQYHDGKQLHPHPHPHPHLLSRSPHRPHIVSIFEFIAGDLLLIAGAPPIRVLEGVEE